LLARANGLAAKRGWDLTGLGNDLYKNPKKKVRTQKGSPKREIGQALLLLEQGGAGGFKPREGGKPNLREGEQVWLKSEERSACGPGVPKMERGHF